MRGCMHIMCGVWDNAEYLCLQELHLCLFLLKFQCVKVFWKKNRLLWCSLFHEFSTTKQTLNAVVLYYNYIDF